MCEFERDSLTRVASGGSSRRTSTRRLAPRLRLSAIAAVATCTALGLTACGGDDNQTATYYPDANGSTFDGATGSTGSRSSGAISSSSGRSSASSTSSGSDTGSSSTSSSSSGSNDDGGSTGTEPDGGPSDSGALGDGQSSTDGAFPDSGRGVDATLGDAAVTDATLNDSGGGGNDAAHDGASCVPYDAAGISAEAVDAGLALVRQFHCAGCHQTTPDAGIILSGNANGVRGAFPPNLTPDPATGLGCWTDPQIVRAVLQGFDNTDAALCVMPRFGIVFQDAGLEPDAAALEIAQFLRTLPAVSNRVPETNCAALSEAGTDAGADAADASALDAADAEHADAADAAHDASDGGDGH